MRNPLYSLRTGILAQLAILVVAAMLLINAVMAKFAERDLIRARREAAEVAIQALGPSVGQALSRQRKGILDPAAASRFERDLGRLLAVGEFSEIVIVNATGDLLFSVRTGAGPEDRGRELAGEALRTGTWSTRYNGRTWGVIWPGYAELRVAAPLVFEGRPRGGITVGVPLKPIYRTLRASQKVILLYVLVDTLILTVVGLYLLSRIVVKPIHRLLRITAQYGEGRWIPAPAETPRNEIGELARALGNMLKRLSENKEELQAHILSLERANREIREAQEEVIRSEKLASVGRLAAGVAHEIGNPVGIVLGYLDMLSREGLTAEERRDFLGRMASEMTRVHEIIGQMLDFSRPSSGSPEQINVHAALYRTLDILRPQPMMEAVSLDLHLDAAEDRVLADPGQLQQVFLNIIMNAADALAEGRPPGGETGEKTLAIESRNREKALEISFADNGPGVPEKDLDRIFDPFFTSKEPGRGTGLGLAVSYRIVEGLGGGIRAESAGGKGTTVTVTLPLLEPEAQA